MPLKYGPEPYRLEMQLVFPPSFPDIEEKGADATVTIEMAPLSEMPYSVLTFLDMVRGTTRALALASSRVPFVRSARVPRFVHRQRPFTPRRHR